MRLAGLLLLWLLAAPLHAATAEAWLGKVAQALKTLDYRGTVVVVADGRVETLRVLHRYDGGRERERLVALSGPPREVVRDGDRITCIGLGDAAAFAVAGGWTPARALGEAAGLRGYAARLGGRGRVAGHAAQVVDVAAADGWRYGYRLWLEQGTGLPLRVDLIGHDGRAIEQVAFTELELGVAPADEELAASGPATATPVPAAPAADPVRAARGWRVASPPPGFELRGASAIPGGLHLVYGDGLATVSVYVERAGPGLRGSASRRSGALSARTYWTDGWRVMAMGKVPAATVDHFARNLRAGADG